MKIVLFKLCTLVIQERLVEQVHEMDDQISNNKSETITELQVCTAPASHSKY